MAQDSAGRGAGDLEREAILRLSAARDLLGYVVAGHVVPQPWVDGAARLIAEAVWRLTAAA